MRPSTSLLILGVTLLLLATLTEAKKPPARRRQKKPSILSSFFGRAPRSKSQSPQESKRVFYYSVPATSEKPPRIILGNELDFTQLGIQNGASQKQLRLPERSPSSLSEVEQAYYDHYGDDDDMPVPHPPLPRGPGPRRHPRFKKRGKRPRHRGPGYRLERPWNEHYVLEDDYHPQNHPQNHQKKNQLAVMPYLKSAGRNIVGAYRAAVLQSAKVVHFTGDTASKYFQGVRNLVARSDPARPDTKKSDSTLQPIQTTPQNSIILKQELLPQAKDGDIVEIDLSKNSGEDASGAVLPKVYLDWGGSFWRFFYNKNNDIPAKDRADADVGNDNY